MKPYIVDVYLSVPDHTFYPLNGRSKYNDVYAAQSLEELTTMLASDGWKTYGMIQMNDGTIRNLLQKNPTELIAIAEEN